MEKIAASALEVNADQRMRVASHERLSSWSIGRRRRRRERKPSISAKKKPKTKKENAKATGRPREVGSDDLASAALAARSYARTDYGGLSPAGLGRWSAN